MAMRGSNRPSPAVGASIGYREWAHPGNLLISNALRCLNVLTALSVFTRMEHGLAQASEGVLKRQEHKVNALASAGLLNEGPGKEMTVARRNRNVAIVYVFDRQIDLTTYVR